MSETLANIIAIVFLIDTTITVLPFSIWLFMVIIDAIFDKKNK